MTPIDDPPDRRRARCRRSGALALVLLVPLSAAAQNRVDFAPDITAPLGTGPSLVVEDHNLAHDDATGGVTGFLIPPGALPPNVEIAGYHPLASGNTLLALDTTTALPGLASPAEPRDVVEYDRVTGTFSLFFDGSAAGVPTNAKIDALTVTAPPALAPQLSFDTSVTLPGVGPVDDEDIVVFSGGVFAMVFDGSAAGVPTRLDLDAVDRVVGPAGWLMSFDTSGSIGALVFDDEDVLRYDVGLGTFAMYFDASLSDPVDWPRADLSALPEPPAVPGLAAAAALLAGLCGRRTRRR